MISNSICFPDLVEKLHYLDLLFTITEKMTETRQRKKEKNPTSENGNDQLPSEKQENKKKLSVSVRMHCCFWRCFFPFLTSTGEQYLSQSLQEAAQF